MWQTLGLIISTAKQNKTPSSSLCVINLRPLSGVLINWSSSCIKNKKSPLATHLSLTHNTILIIALSLPKSLREVCMCLTNLKQNRGKKSRIIWTVLHYVPPCTQSVPCVHAQIEHRAWLHVESKEPGHWSMISWLQILAQLLPTVCRLLDFSVAVSSLQSKMGILIVPIT